MDYSETSTKIEYKRTRDKVKWIVIFITIIIGWLFLILTMNDKNRRFERIMRIKEKIIMNKPLNKDDEIFFDKLTFTEQMDILELKRKVKKEYENERK